MSRVIFDTETRSHCDITRGLDVYASHHTTQLVCAAIETVNWKAAAAFIPSCDGRPALETKMRESGLTVVSPDVLLRMLCTADTVVAHNFAFDQVVTAKLTGLHIPDEKWSCTMSRAMRHGLPGALGNVCNVLGFGDDGKDKEGSRLLKQVMKPRPAWTKWHATPPAERKKLDSGPEWFDDADRLARIALYCARDVSATLRLDQMIPELEPSEREIWLHVHDMNCRGLPLDRQLIDGAIRISEEAQRDIQDRIRHYTGGMVQSLKAPGQITQWAARYGYPLESVTKDEIAATLANPNLPEPVRVVCQARQEAGRGSVAKYETAADMLSPDGRLRHQLLYAGTSTLRLAGRGVQPLNLPRPKIMADQSAGLADIKAGRPVRIPEWKLRYDPEKALAAIRSGDLAALREMGDSEEILSDNIRCMIEAPAGLKIASPDLSAIEARGVFWISSCEKALDVIRKSDAGLGPDIYCQLASTMFGFPVVKKEHPEERQYGKVGVLSCFEAGTGVLTRTRGVVPIEDITVGDELWDGIEWVRHEGVVARGARHTTNFLGVRVTPEHLIMTRQGWRTAADLQAKRRLSESDLAIWSSADTKHDVGRTAACETQVELISGANASAVGFARRLWKTLKRGVLRGAITARMTWPPRRKWLLADMSTQCRKATIGEGGLGDIRLCWPARTTARARPQKTISIAASQYGRIGSTLRHFFYGCARNRNGIAPNTAWNAMTLTGRIALTTADLRPRASKSVISADRIESNTREKFTAPPNFTQMSAPAWPKSPSPVSQKPAGPANDSLHTNPRDVFDVSYCGPRNRFTVVTPQGFCLLVHNCGYGAGAAKVALTNKIDEEMSQRIVSTYRGDYAEVPATWRDLEYAAIDAIRNPGWTTDACRGRVHFMFEGGWLRMQRPSGVWMYLPDAGVDFEGRLYYHSWIKGGWREESIWGGVLINFVTQGFCREIMYGAEMRLAKDPRLELFLQCYDSLSALVRAEQAKELCDMMIKEMTTPPAWALDMPLAAEGKPKGRYS